MNEPSTLNVESKPGFLVEWIELLQGARDFAFRPSLYVFKLDGQDNSAGVLISLGWVAGVAGNLWEWEKGQPQFDPKGAGLFLLLMPFALLLLYALVRWQNRIAVFLGGTSARDALCGLCVSEFLFLLLFISLMATLKWLLIRPAPWLVEPLEWLTQGLSYLFIYIFIRLQARLYGFSFGRSLLCYTLTLISFLTVILTPCLLLIIAIEMLK